MMSPRRFAGCVAIFVATLSACAASSTQGQPSSASVSPHLTLSQSAQPSQHESSPWFGEVLTEQLVVYMRPSSDSEELGQVPQGQVVHVVDEQPSGWARVQFMYLHPTSTEWLFGWAQLGPDGNPAFAPAELAECGSPQIANLAAMPPSRALDCFGGQDFQVQGWAVTIDDFHPPLFSGTPAWLATPSSVLIMSTDPEIGGPALPVHLAPGLEVDWPVGAEIEVTATYGYEASSTCRRVGPGETDRESEAESILWCEQQLVIEDLRVVAE